MTGEQPSEDFCDIDIGIMVLESDQMVVQSRRLAAQILQQEIIGRRLGAGVRYVETQRQRAIQDVCQSDKGISRCRKINEEKRCDGLKSD